MQKSRSRNLAFASALIALSVVPCAHAQDASSCVPVLDSTSAGGIARHLTNQRTGRVRRVAMGGVWFSCASRIGTPSAGTVVWNAYSDSVSHHEDLGRIDFVGAVRFNDSTASLDADRASYYQNGDRLEAFDNVRLENRESGSVLTGPHLIYNRVASWERDEAELFATRRPTVEYRSEGDSANPTVVVGDRVRLVGNDHAWVGGNVTIERKDFAASGDSATLDLALEEGLLIGHAEAVGQDSVGYTLHGRRIAFRMQEGELTWVQAQELAEGISADWRVLGDTIEFAVANDMIQSGQVWGDSTRARAMSTTHTITADSLAVDMPDQILSEVRAFRGARATARPDSVSTEVDWIAGDTVIAMFDSTDAGTRTLSELHAKGEALAFYLIYDEENPDLAPAISYSRGKEIIALFEEEELISVRVIEEADGVYLVPSRVPTP